MYGKLRLIVGVNYKLEFDNENPEELDKALELLDWFDNEQVYPEDMEVEKYETNKI